MKHEKSDLRSTESILSLGMALKADSSTMEQRIRGIFSRKSSKAASAFAFLIAVFLIVGCFTTACRPVSAAKESPAAEGETAAPAPEGKAPDGTAPLLAFAGPASAKLDGDTVTVTLPETLTVIGSDKSEAEQNLSSEVQLTVQPAIDALLIDRPEIAVWLDVTGTRFSFAYSIGSDGEGNCVINLSKLFLNIKSNPDVYDPDGMVSGIRQVISSFVPSGNTRYEILKSIHDFVCGLTVYDNDAAAGKETGSKFAHHAFGALIDGRAVCQGYSEAFKLICDANGIPCVLV